MSKRQYKVQSAKCRVKGKNIKDEAQRLAVQIDGKNGGNFGCLSPKNVPKGGGGGK